MDNTKAEIVDITGAFLKRDIEDGEEIHMELPEGCKHMYPQHTIVKLKKAIYGLKQAAKCFWVLLLKIMMSMGNRRSSADPCMYYSWTALGLVIWLSHIDDCLVVGKKEAAKQARINLMKKIDCEHVAEVHEQGKLDFIGMLVNKEGSTAHLTMPVMTARIKEEYGNSGKKTTTPAVPGSHLHKDDNVRDLNEKEHNEFRSGQGVINYLQKVRPDCANAIRETASHMSAPNEVHQKELQRIMDYINSTPERCLQLAPTGIWNGERETELQLRGVSDSDFGKNEDNRKSVTGYVVYLNDAPVAFKSSTQQTVSLSSAEAELNALVSCAQELLYVMNLLESMELTVNKPMVIKCDNKGTVAVAHNWVVSGRMRHVAIKKNFMRELEEKNIIHVEWIEGVKNEADAFTKNVNGVKLKEFMTNLMLMGVEE